MAQARILGPIPAKVDLAVFLLNEGIRLGTFWANQLATDPSGKISRIGDALVWNTSSGQQVVAGLTQLSESQARIEKVVNHIETVPLAASHTLGVAHTLSIASLGISSITGAYMAWRVEALNKRFERLSNVYKDVDDNLDARSKAHLRKAVQMLREFDESSAQSAVTITGNEAQNAVNIFGDLTLREAAKKQPRVEVLNYRSRCYLLGLMAEIQSRFVLDQLPAAVARIKDEKPRLQSIAKSTFDIVIQDSPETYLRAEMANEGVTLDLMTELYRQARTAGAITKPEIESAGQLFEHCRSKVIGAGRWWASRRDSKQDATQLRFLMACLEEINRIDGMRLLMSESLAKQSPFPSIHEKVREWSNEKAGAKPDASDEVIAYSFT